MRLKQEAEKILGGFGVAKTRYSDGDLTVTSPLTGDQIAHVQTTSVDEARVCIETADRAFKSWRMVPAPRRGQLIRLLGEELRKAKEDLSRLVSLEVGKIPSESTGEVQEMIDICDFAVGLSRQLYGLTISTERSEHRMMETWHPLGPVGVISAFNFPVAVWSWNAALAIVCGDSVIWKPSEKAPLTALACEALFRRALDKFGDAPEGLLSLMMGGQALGETLVDHAKVALVSATGSTRMGRQVGPRLAKRFARAVLELGGNNACIVCPSADLDMAVRAIAFSAMGTAGQRCTTLRRLFVHERIYNDLVPKLKKAYQTVSVGNPLQGNYLVGPLIDETAYENMQRALEEIKISGGKITGGERVNTGHDAAYYVRPALAELPKQEGIVLEETFAPILYTLPYTSFDEALECHNAVGAGLSSCVFTRDIREAEIFMSARGSDCGIVNVNIGTSGAEIGGAFGGEKETGGGRESGSDAWKNYMRRATNTINYSSELPLAQGVNFDVDP